jgi:hypothetical protein
MSEFDEVFCVVCGGTYPKEIKTIRIPVSWDDRPDGGIYDEIIEFDMCLYHRYQILILIKNYIKDTKTKPYMEKNNEHSL